MSSKAKAARKPRSPKKPRSTSVSAKSAEKPNEADKLPRDPEIPGEEVPGDLKAFFGHPLLNREDNQASALALLHEYQNLPAIDHTDNKIRDRYDNFSDILSKNEHNRSGGSDQYSLLMHSDVDAFLNISSSSSQRSGRLESSPAIISPKSEESMHSSGGILDVSGSPKDTTDINASPEYHVDFPDLPVNSPPTDPTNPDHHTVSSPPALQESEDLQTGSNSTFKRSSPFDDNSVEYKNTRDNFTKYTGELKPEKEDGHLYQSKDPTDPFGLQGSHNGYPPVTRTSDEKQRPKAVSILNKSVFVSKATDTAYSSNGYSYKQESGSPYNSHIAYISPQAPIGANPHKKALKREKQTMESQVVPTENTRTDSGLEPRTNTDKTVAQNKYIQEFQDFVSKTESISQLESALRAPRKFKSSSEPEVTKTEGEQSADNKLPPPPPYTPNAFHGLNVPPISAICRQIQKDYPGLAGIPLTIIEKSLETLGFPIGSQNLASVLPQQFNQQNLGAAISQISATSNQAMHVPPSVSQKPKDMVPHTTMPSPCTPQTNVLATTQTQSLTSQNEVEISRAQTSAQSIETFSKLCQNGTIRPTNPQSLINPQGLQTVPSQNSCTMLNQQPNPVNNLMRQTVPTTQGLSLAAHLLAQQALQRSMAVLQAQQMASIASAQPQNSLPFGAVVDKQNAPNTPSPGMVSPAMDNTLLSSLVRNALFPQINNSGGNAPSHVILPKSLFNMATQGLIPVASPTTLTQPPAKTPDTGDKNLVSGPVPMPESSHETTRNECPTLTEYLKTHQSGLLNLGRQFSNSATQPNVLEEDRIMVEAAKGTLNTRPQGVNKRPSFLPVSSSTPFNQPYQYPNSNPSHMPPYASTRLPDTPDQMLEAAAMVTGKQAAHHQRNLLLAHAALVSGKNPEDIFNSSTASETIQSPVAINTSPMESPNVYPSGRQSAPPLSPFMQCQTNPRIQTIQQRNDPASAPTTPIYSSGQVPLPHLSQQNSTIVSKSSAQDEVRQLSSMDTQTGPVEKFSNAENINSKYVNLPQSAYQQNMPISSGYQPHITTEQNILRNTTHGSNSVPPTQSLSISVPTTTIQSLPNRDYAISQYCDESRAEMTVLDHCTSAQAYVPHDEVNVTTARSQNKSKKKKTAKVSANVASTNSLSAASSNKHVFSDKTQVLNTYSSVDFAHQDAVSQHTVDSRTPTTTVSTPINPQRSLLTESSLHKHLQQYQRQNASSVSDGRSGPQHCDPVVRKHELGGQLQQYLAEVAGLSVGIGKPSVTPVDGSSPSIVENFNNTKSTDSNVQVLSKTAKCGSEYRHDSNSDGQSSNDTNNIPSDTTWSNARSMVDPYSVSPETAQPPRFPVQPVTSHSLSKNTRESPVVLNTVRPMDTSSNLLMIKPQNAPVTPPNPVNNPPYNDLKSPDSGIGESCVSPSETVFSQNNGSDTATSQSGDTPLKRKRPFPSRPSSRPVSTFSLPERRSSATVHAVTKLNPSLCNYKCYMDTPISASQKIEDDRITYMNKGQFYNVIVEYKSKSRPLPSSTVKSVVMVLFRDDKSVLDEFRAWQFWHNRQHSVKQRILDIDLKSSDGLIVSSIEETSHNAITFKWNPMKQNAKISITINCLSTDFSNQKGVKGLPLHVQVDTFEEESNPIPVHRAYCQVKVFCDKGAERKARDEERKKEAKCKQPEHGEKPVSVPHGKKNKVERKFHPPCDVSDFYDVADLKKEPILFSPVKETEESSPPPKAIVFPTIDPKMAQVAAQVFTGSSTSEQEPQPKRPRQAVEPSTRRVNEKVLLYVRESHEAVFTALLLLQPTLDSLIKAVEEKYGIPISNITNVYKRSKKGILVKMDDNIVRHYSNESTFLITLTKYLSPSDGTTNYDVTLQDLD